MSIQIIQISLLLIFFLLCMSYSFCLFFFFWSPDVHYPITSPDNGGCKSGYFHYRDSCYGAYRLPKTWSEAESVCVLDGAHLVSLRDIHELAKVQLFVYDSVIIHPIWIGLSFREVRCEISVKRGFNW